MDSKPSRTEGEGLSRGNSEYGRNCVWQKRTLGVIPCVWRDIYNGMENLGSPKHAAAAPPRRVRVILQKGWAWNEDSVNCPSVHLSTWASSLCYISAVLIRRRHCPNSTLWKFCVASRVTCMWWWGFLGAVECYGHHPALSKCVIVVLERACNHAWNTTTQHMDRSWRSWYTYKHPKIQWLFGKCAAIDEAYWRRP